MSLKKFGIYLAFPPSVDLRAQGLGRLLTEFLKASQERKDICFVLAYPSWMKPSLVKLFENENIPLDCFEMITPKKKILLLNFLNLIIASKELFKVYHQLKKAYTSIKKCISKLIYNVSKIIVTTRSKIFLGLFLLIILPFLSLALVIILAKILLKVVVAGLYASARKFGVGSFLKKLAPFQQNIAHDPFKQFLIFMNKKTLNWINDLIFSLKDNWIVLELYKALRMHEATLMNNLINSRSDIIAWYCPTSFWPDFHGIKAPRLMCVPDVVLTDFPISFARISNNRFLDSFKQVEQSITKGEYFVTYSEEVKWHTLVPHFHTNPNNIFVIPHGVNSLNELINFSDSLSNRDTLLTALCHNLFKDALSKSHSNIDHSFIVNGPDIKYIFYASQFRPNKNVISLLKAYEYLLKRRYLPHKLILTGIPKVLPEIQEFIESHNLENDVLCLHALSAQQLAACYKLADLAVNPSLSEGGCPFTLTEALSVDTPVVMARIPVTLEVIKDSDLTKEMLFDPYDWRDIADRIEWALKNKEKLLAKQKIFYSILEKRTWSVVVDEYINVLDYISAKSFCEEKLKDAA